MLSLLTSDCVGIFDKLTTTIGTDKAAELYLWLKATQCFYDRDIGRNLKVAHLSDGSDDGAFKMQAFGNVLSIIVGKLSNAVIGE